MPARTAHSDVTFTYVQSGGAREVVGSVADLLAHHPDLANGVAIRLSNASDVRQAEQPAEAASGEPYVLVHVSADRVPVGILALLERFALDQQVADALGSLAHTPSEASVVIARNGLSAWDNVKDRYGVYTAAELADVAGSKARNRSSYAADLLRKGRAIAVRRGRENLFPAFQFDDAGEPWSVLSSIIPVFRGAAWSDFSIVMWMTSPTGWLGNKEPARLLADAGYTDALVDAAEQTVAA